MSTKATVLAFFLICSFDALTDAHAQTCVPPPSGLVSWWPGDGNTMDVAGGNNGTLQGSATFAPGVVGQAFNFDGAEGAVLIGNPANLRLQTFSIEAWIQRASPTQASAGLGGGCIFCYGSGNYGLVVVDEGAFGPTRIGVDGVASPSLRVVDTTFHHIAITRSEGTVRFYLDGVEDVPVQYDPVFDFTTNVAIGGRGDISFPTGLQFNVFLGAIDDLAIYNRALSAAEVQAIFAAGSAGKCRQLSNDVGGTVTGLRPARVVCRNVTTRQRVVIRDNRPSWNCETAGLDVIPGDIVEITVLGGVN